MCPVWRLSQSVQTFTYTAISHPRFLGKWRTGPGWTLKTRSVHPEDHKKFSENGHSLKYDNLILKKELGAMMNPEGLDCTGVKDIRLWNPITPIATIIRGSVQPTSLSFGFTFLPGHILRLLEHTQSSEGHFFSFYFSLHCITYYFSGYLMSPPPTPIHAETPAFSFFKGSPVSNVPVIDYQCTY